MGQKTNTRNPKWHLVGFLSVTKKSGRNADWRLTNIGGREIATGLFDDMASLGQRINAYMESDLAGLGWSDMLAFGAKSRAEQDMILQSLALA